jgi:hypothetical protein
MMKLFMLCKLNCIEHVSWLKQEENQRRQVVSVN